MYRQFEYCFLQFVTTIFKMKHKGNKKLKRAAKRKLNISYEGVGFSLQ